MCIYNSKRRGCISVKVLEVIGFGTRDKRLDYWEQFDIILTCNLLARNANY